MKCARIVVALLLGVSVARPAAAWFEERDLGVRSIGFGRAFTAVADDATALYWNPGGLAGLTRHEAQIGISRPYTISGLNSSYVAGAWRTALGTVAASWQNVAAVDIVSENTFSLGIGRQVYTTGGSSPIRFDAGAAVKLYRIGFAAFPDPVTLQSVDFGSATAAAVDLGVMARLPRGFTVGWTLHDIGEPEFDFVDGAGGGTAISMRHRVGMAYRWNPESTVSFDWQELSDGDTRVVMAGEIWFYNSFAVRGGITGNDAGGGVSVKSRRWIADFGFLTNQPLGISYRAGLRVPL